jgi:broad specificity phosphatase PhoE
MSRTSWFSQLGKRVNKQAIDPASTVSSTSNSNKVESEEDPSSASTSLSSIASTASPSPSPVEQRVEPTLPSTTTAEPNANSEIDNNTEVRTDIDIADIDTNVDIDTSATASASPALATSTVCDTNTTSQTSCQLLTAAHEKPKYFSGQYEYEVSPTSSPIINSCPEPDTDSDSDHQQTIQEKDGKPQTFSNTAIASSTASNINIVIMERMVPVTKTVFLIRHAQSDENRRLASLTTTLKSITKLKLPTKTDVLASCELLNVPAQLDSDVSPEGKAQIDALGRQIEKDDFIQKMGIQLVAHSPLKRARQTSEGMLQCVTKSLSATAEEDSSALGKKHDAVGRVVELPVLNERTPIEWLPVNHDAFTKRIAEFEKWLGEQPEDVIAIVGHSQYFKSMLGLPKKFKNVDVWSLQFDSTVQKSHEDVKMEINTKEREERNSKLKKKLDNALNAGSGHGSDNGDGAADSDHDSSNHGESNANSNANEDSGVFETANEIYEIDNVRVDDLELPRGWRDLKRHYTFDPSMLDQE